MSTEISIVRQDGNGKLTITGGGVGTSYLYPPFMVLFSANEDGATKYVLRSDTVDHVLFVNDQQSLEILSGFQRLNDDVAAKAALDRHAERLKRAEERRNSPPAPAAPLAPAPASVPAAPQPKWATNPTGYSAPAVPSAAARRANGAARAVETLAWIGALLGLIGGIVVATRTEGDSYYDNVSHPYIGVGILIIVLSVAQALPTIMVAAYIQSRTE